MNQEQQLRVLALAFARCQGTISIALFPTGIMQRTGDIRAKAISEVLKNLATAFKEAGLVEEMQNLIGANNDTTT